jgi:hypothetical protein
VEGFQLLQHDDDHGFLVRAPRVVVHVLAEGGAAAGEMLAQGTVKLPEKQPEPAPGRCRATPRVRAQRSFRTRTTT